MRDRLRVAITSPPGGQKSPSRYPSLGAIPQPVDSLKTGGKGQPRALATKRPKAEPMTRKDVQCGLPGNPPVSHGRAVTADGTACGRSRVLATGLGQLMSSTRAAVVTAAVRSLVFSFHAVSSTARSYLP